MQLIWVAGPAARVITLSITGRKVLAALACLSSLLVLLGAIFHFIGLRVAIEYVPELALSIGGVTSQSEQMKMEAIYRAKLDTLNQQLEAVTGRLQQLESTKTEVMGRLGLEKLLPGPSGQKNTSAWGRGGPLNFLPLWSVSTTPLSQQLDRSLQQMLHYEKSLEGMQTQWQMDLARLERVPGMLPLSGEFLMVSGFGVRADPMTHLPSMHEGLDFVAPVGTPVLVTAPGRVLRAENAGAYGHLVEVEHDDGFVTRYAHLKTMAVQLGQKLNRLESVGTLGNTGRSTGPHLHYEVLFRGQPMHPAKALAAWARD